MNTPGVSPRPATLEDIGKILKIENLSFPEPWSEANFVSEIKKPYSKFLVLTDDETDEVILGYMIYWLQGEGTSLLTLGIHPEWRGFGFAKMLLTLMINDTVKQELPKITLEVRASNLGAIKLYEQMGFKKIHMRPQFYQDGENAWVMELKTSEIQAMLQ